MARQGSARSTTDPDRPLKSVDRIELWNTFNIVLRRLAEKLVVGAIHDETVTVADQMEWLLARLQSEKSFVFSQLFPAGVSLRRLVATFFALLELTRIKKLRCGGGVFRHHRRAVEERRRPPCPARLRRGPSVENPLETTENPPR